MKDYFRDSSMVAQPPVKRAAYSDRTAWIMAELSRLVYERLPDERTTAELIREIRESVARGDDDSTLSALLKRSDYGNTSHSNVVEEALRDSHFELLDCFMSGGTEAILVKLDPTEKFEGMLVLVFRGTQPNITDIVTDLRANLVAAPEGGRVHKGFYDAFENVRDQIELSLDRHPGLPVYVTGHSLGGALAIIAVAQLVNDSVGACYTFGAPRAADDLFFRNIKTPIYRVVNAADGVARVPFGYGLSIALSVVRLIPVNFTFALSEFLRRHLSGYTHWGHIVFMNHVENRADDNGFAFSGLKVKHSPNFFWRAGVVLQRLLSTGFKAAAADHSISDYSIKLLAHKWPGAHDLGH